MIKDESDICLVMCWACFKEQIFLTSGQTGDRLQIYIEHISLPEYFNKISFHDDLFTHGKIE